MGPLYMQFGGSSPLFSLTLPPLPHCPLTSTPIPHAWFWALQAPPAHSGGPISPFPLFKHLMAAFSRDESLRGFWSCNFGGGQLCLAFPSLLWPLGCP